MTDGLIELEQCEEEVPSSDELLYRQITDHHWDTQSSKPATHAFGPSTIDKGMASFSRSSVVSSTDSQKWHNEHASSPSVGVWAVTSSEVEGQQLRTIDDSGCPGDHSPGHCYVDYRHLAGDKTSERKVRAMLLAQALARGPIAT
jgi:hypothetical protein